MAPGVQVLPDRLDGVHSIDRASGLVTVEAGIPLHRLNPLLAEHGLAMEILGDIDRQTIAGAVSTGTHGSGRELRQHLHPGARRWSWSSPTAPSCTCSPTERPELFAAARVSIGALGVITKVTLQCVPLYALHAVDAPMPLDDVLDRVDDLVADQRPLRVLLVPAHHDRADPPVRAAAR